MPVTRLVVSNFRNIADAVIHPADRVNFICGENGSGKTSILEALNTLALGRSFRTRKYKNIIQYDQSQMTLFCSIEDRTKCSIKHEIGVLRSSAGFSTFKLDGKKVSSSTELANLIPLQVINSNSFNLLTGGPSERRQFFDWLVFHVKHSFQAGWRDYMHCLKQRNSALRSDRITISELEPWNLELSRLGEIIGRVRQQTIEEFLPVFNRYSSTFDFIESGSFSIEYIKGWSSEKTLYSSLEDNYSRDCKLGYTSVGPHKSDIKLKFKKRAVTELFSRGQQKTLVTALFMAQIESFIKDKNNGCILLIDDLPAELDKSNLQLVAGWLSKLINVQIFITGIDLADLINLWPEQQLEQSKLFHVKHGTITEQTLPTE